MQAIEESGSQSALERKTGVKQNNISKYISGQTDSITLAIWEKLSPTLRPFLTGDVINTGVIGNGRIYGAPDSGGDFFTFMSKIEKKIIDHEALSPEEKIKFLKILKE